ncbi:MULTISPECIES: hypothetical protein [Legionella]|nr:MULTISPECIES: hypothetical protein [Legionella]
MAAISLDNCHINENRIGNRLQAIIEIALADPGKLYFLTRNKSRP